MKHADLTMLLRMLLQAPITPSSNACHYNWKHRPLSRDGQNKYEETAQHRARLHSTEKQQIFENVSKNVLFLLHALDEMWYTLIWTSVATDSRAKFILICNVCMQRSEYVHEEDCDPHLRR